MTNENGKVTPGDKRLGLPVGRASLTRMLAEDQRATGKTNDYVVIRGACHRDAGTIVSYWRQAGLLVLECRACQSPILSIKVGK